MRDCDVIVIGAGAAGLAAASYLRRSRKGIRLLMLEARSRLGGRMWTEHLWPDRQAVELGAEFIHDSKAGRNIPELERVRGTRVMWGKTRFLLDGQTVRGEATREARLGVWGWIGRYRKETGSIGDVLARWSPQARLIAAAEVEGEYAATPECVSMSAAYHQWVQWEGGEEDEFHTKGSYASLANQLAKGIEIEFDDPVREVRWARGSVEVTTVSGGRYRARCAISTLPLGVLQKHKVRFTPVLSRAKRNAVRDLGVGRVVKILMRSDSIPKGVVNVVSDCAVPLWWSSRVGQKGVLVGWAGGRAADALRKIRLESIKRRAAQSIEAIFPGMQPVVSEDIHVVDWCEEFSLGAYSYTPKDCDGDALRSALAAPERDTLFFAGEATDRVYFATVTGAMRSGQCAARSVLAIL